MLVSVEDCDQDEEQKLSHQGEDDAEVVDCGGEDGVGGAAPYEFGVKVSIASKRALPLRRGRIEIDSNGLMVMLIATSLLPEAGAAPSRNRMTAK
jgi:hypothetical protein